MNEERKLMLVACGGGKHLLLINGVKTEIMIKELDKSHKNMTDVRLRQTLEAFCKTRNEFVDDDEKDRAVNLMLKLLTSKWKGVSISNVQISTQDTVKRAVSRALYGATLRAQQDIPS